MSRLAPYRTKMPELVKARIDQTLATTMYLVQTIGPTSYVVFFPVHSTIDAMADSSENKWDVR